MKKILYPLFMIVFNYGHSQVGVNTDTPNATLEVKSSATDQSTVDGIILPKLTGNELQSKNSLYLSNQTGAIVYVTNGVIGDRELKTDDVTTEGLYQFNGIKWIRLKSNSDSDVNIYTTDGTLTGYRTVDMLDKSLRFSGTSYGSFSVERRNDGGGPSSSYFSLRRNRSLILGENKALRLNDYIGAITFSGNTGSDFDDDFLNNSSIISITEEDFTSTTKGSKLVFKTVPIGSKNSADRLTIKGDGKVGIGTNTPNEVLHVNGAAQITGALKVGGSTGNAGTTGQVLVSKGSNAAPNWENSANYKSIVLGDFSDFPSGGVNSNNSSGILYTGIKLELTKGKWIINMGLLFENSQTVSARHWITLSLSSSKTAKQYTGFTNLGRAGNNSGFAGVISRVGSGTITNDKNSFITGSNIIDVTADTATVYLLVDNKATNVFKITGGWEDFLYATPVN